MHPIHRYLYTVAFVTVERDLDSGTAYEAVGTAFIIESQSGEYVVTAGHVVENYSQTYLRLRSGNRTVLAPSTDDWWDIEDVPVTWTHHEEGESVDLAAARLGDRVSRSTHGYTSVRAGVGRRPELGDKIYYLGLLPRVSQMGDRLVPFVRSGTLGAFDQKGIPIDTGDTYITTDGHIVDCHGHGGFSGAPVFSYHSDVESDMSKRQARLAGREPQPKKSESVSLLGAFLGFFRDPDRRGPINTGVGVVSPVARIRELGEQVVDG